MKVSEILKKNKPLIQRGYFVKEMGLFGSFVHGRQTRASDIDILVEFKKKHKDFFNYIRLKHYLEKLLGREVDLVMKKAVRSRLRERILGETKYV